MCASSFVAPQVFPGRLQVASLSPTVPGQPKGLPRCASLQRTPDERPSRFAVGRKGAVFLPCLAGGPGWHGRAVEIPGLFTSATPGTTLPCSWERRSSRLDAPGAKRWRSNPRAHPAAATRMRPNAGPRRWRLPPGSRSAPLCLQEASRSAAAAHDQPGQCQEPGWIIVPGR